MNSKIVVDIVFEIIRTIDYSVTVCVRVVMGGVAVMVVVIIAVRMTALRVGTT